jgi:hypothetical protein
VKGYKKSILRFDDRGHLSGGPKVSSSVHLGVLKQALLTIFSIGDKVTKLN